MKCAIPQLRAPTLIYRQRPPLDSLYSTLLYSLVANSSSRCSNPTLLTLILTFPKPTLPHSLHHQNFLSTPGNRIPSSWRSCSGILMTDRRKSLYLYGYRVRRSYAATPVTSTSTFTFPDEKPKQSTDIFLAFEIVGVYIPRLSGPS